MRSKTLAVLGALALASVLAFPPDVRAYESIRRDSPLGRRLAETARRTGTPVELLLGPRAWRPTPVVRDSAERAALRAAALARAQARLDLSTDGAPAILFAGPPLLDSMPPRPPGPTIPDSLTSGLLSFAVGDLDGDGLPDLVGVQSADSVLDVRRNLGGGAYAPAVRYPLANGASEVVLGDFNGDRRPDVVVGNFHESPRQRFSTLLNLGDGALGARSDHGLPFTSNDVLVADLGHDGRDDLVFCLSFFAGAVVVPSLADGTFGPAEIVAPGTPGEYDGLFPVAAVGDIDGDGNLDIALAYRHGDCFGSHCVTLAVFYGRDDRTFEAPSTYQGRGSGGLSTFWTTGLDLQDVDGDHRTDIVVSGAGASSYDPAYPALIRNAGERRLEAPSLRDVARTPWTLAAGRFRAGEPQDLVVSDDATVTLLRNHGNGTFADEVGLAPGTLLEVVDLDGDGRSEVVSAVGDVIEIRRADGTGGFLPPATVTDGRFLATADFTGDHRLDLAVILPNDDLGVLAGDGFGGFEAVQDFGPVTGLRFPLQAADFDGDGVADLASARSGEFSVDDARDSLVVWWGTGAGFAGPSGFNLGPARPYAHGPWMIPLDLRSGDFNGDGQLDLAVVQGSPGMGGDRGLVFMLPNLGSRAFGPPSPALVTGVDPYAGTVADFDGDGLDDLAVVEMSTDDTGTFSVFKGSPDGTLAAVPPPPHSYAYLLHHWAWSITAGDFDGDGRTDIAAGCGSRYEYGEHVVLAVPNITPFGETIPTLASLVRADAWPDHVSLLWDLGGAHIATATIERRTPSADWIALARVSPDGAGRVRFEDRTVIGGARYAYRLRLGGAAGNLTTPETWIEVPAALAFALEGPRPNPTRGPLAVAFTLPGSARATLDVLDVTGRRVRSRTLESPAAGRQQLSLEGDGALAPGLYFVRLSQGQRIAHTRVAVVR